jgi:RepB DNA-primase N-terminal domain
MPAVSPKEFLQALWGAQPGVAELTTIVTTPATPEHPRTSTIKSFGFNHPSGLDELIASAGRHNRTSDVYMGVCLRRSQWELGKRGTEDLALSSNVVWLDIDFAEDGHKGKTIPKLQAHKMVQEFKNKPSIIVRTGGGVHVYWLLKEPAMGAELRNVKQVNKALTKYFVGSDSTADLARILRIPGFVNHKYAPARLVEVLFWNPDLRYTLFDFDFLPQEEEPRFSLVPPAPAGTPAGQAPGAPAPVGSSAGRPQPRPTPTTELDDEACSIAGKLFAQIWFEGYRHEMALCVAGWLAFAGVKYESALKIVQVASDLNRGDTKKRLKDVEDTYKKFVEGGEVKGRPTLETMIDEAFPDIAKPQAKKALDGINKVLPKPRGFRKGSAAVDFKITHLVKYTSQPPVWTVTIEKAGQKLVTKCEHSRFMKYENFCEDVMDQNRIAPEAALKNPEWRHLINEATNSGEYEEKEAPKETRTLGAMEKGLEEFLAEAKENPDIGLLKKFAGYDDENVFFRLEALRAHYKEQGREFSQNQLTEHLRNNGYESKVRRFGKKTPHVWQKALIDGMLGDGGDHGPGGNGNGNGNGHHGNGNGNGNGNGHGPSSLGALPSVDQGSGVDTPTDLFPEVPPGEGD